MYSARRKQRDLTRRRAMRFSDLVRKRCLLYVSDLNPSQRGRHPRSARGFAWVPHGFRMGPAAGSAGVPEGFRRGSAGVPRGGWRVDRTLISSLSQVADLNTTKRTGRDLNPRPDQKKRNTRNQKQNKNTNTKTAIRELNPAKTTKDDRSAFTRFAVRVHPGTEAKPPKKLSKTPPTQNTTKRTGRDLNPRPKTKTNRETRRNQTRTRTQKQRSGS